MTADYLYRQFDREILSVEHGSGKQLVTSPDALFQALRPFIGATSGADIVFARIFATSEFRGIGRDLGETLSAVASYLSTYSDMPEETATKILANSLLMSKVKAHAGADRLKMVIDEEIVKENEALLLERDTLLASTKEARMQASEIRTEIDALSEHLDASTGIYDVISRVVRLEDVIEGLPRDARSIRVDGDVNVNQNEYSGGYYENDRSQIAAQGPNAQAHHVTQQADQRGLDVDLRTLVAELDSLKMHLLNAAGSATEYQAVAEIQAAKEAAEQGRPNSILEHLSKAGGWALEVAKNVGNVVAETALKRALGLDG